MKRRVCAICLVALSVVSMSGCGHAKHSKKTAPKQSEEIKLIINDHNINLHGKSVYLTSNKIAMLPLDIVKDDLDIAVNKFSDDKIVVEKSNNKVVIKNNSSQVKIDDREYSITENVVKKDQTLYVPITLFENYLRFSQSYDKKNHSITITDITRGNDLPSKYNYMEEGRSPSVKDQGESGDCWAYASLSAMESTLLPGVSCEFDTKKLTKYAKKYYDVSNGGNYSMTLAYMLSEKGPLIKGENNVKWHLRSAQMFEGKNIKRIKQLLFKYGGVESSIYLDKRVGEDKVHYNGKKSAYYYDESEVANHDIVIVGWDDEYSRKNFATKPQKDGAFICLNSWGKDWGDNGLFYVSYEDKNLGTDNICYTKMDDIDYNLYEADEFGMNSTMSLNDENRAFFANVYKSKGKEKLEAVGFYTTTEDVDYKVYVVENFRGETSLSKLGKAVSEGNISNKGFYTINLDSNIFLEPDQRYAVVVKVKSPNAKDLIPLESQAKDMNVDIKVDENRGYYSASGEFWKRAEEGERNVCLKAYTTNIEYDSYK